MEYLSYLNRRHRYTAGRKARDNQPASKIKLRTLLIVTLYSGWLALHPSTYALTGIYAKLLLTSLGCLRGW